jgi:hypothetical protein
LIEPKRNKKLTQIYLTFFSVINLAEMTGNFVTSLNCRKQIGVTNIQETLKYEM